MGGSEDELGSVQAALGLSGLLDQPQGGRYSDMTESEGVPSVCHLRITDSYYACFGKGCDGFLHLPQ